MRHSFLVPTLIVSSFMVTSASAYQVKFDFEANWSGDYAPGWENSAYRHGEAPVGKMMQQVAGGYLSSNAMKLTADSVPESWMWWAAVNPIDVDATAMQKQYNPYFSAWYYDEGWNPTRGLQSAGQIYAVPNWVNPYIDGSEDWTDIQFGARAALADHYYFVAAGENSPGWQDANVSRTPGKWINLKMQLDSSDGYVDFLINGIKVGQSYRNDYQDLTGVGLYTMFSNTLAEWGQDKPYTIWDNVEFGSTAVPAVPEPFTMALGAMGLGVAALRRRRK